MKVFWTGARHRRGPRGAVRPLARSCPSKPGSSTPSCWWWSTARLAGGETHGMLAGAAAGWVQDVHFGGSRARPLRALQDPAWASRSASRPPASCSPGPGRAPSRCSSPPLADALLFALAGLRLRHPDGRALAPRPSLPAPPSTRRWGWCSSSSSTAGSGARGGVRIYEDLRVVQARLAVVQTHGGACWWRSWASTSGTSRWCAGSYFRDQAENNRTRAVPIAAPRGPLLDRAGRVLVENRPSFNVVLTPEHSDDLDDAVARLARVLGWARRRSASGWPDAAVPFRPVVVKTDATLDDVAAVEARRLRAARGQRGGGAAALLSPGRGRGPHPRPRGRGHRAAARAAGVRGPGGRATSWARPASSRSTTGASWAGTGYRRVIVNSRGVEVEEAERASPGGRARASPSPSTPTCRRPWRQAFQGRAGSAVALDPETGEILAMTSTPGLRPQPLHDRHRARALEPARHRSRHPAHEPGHPGHVRPGQHVQGRDGHGRPRGRGHHALDHLLLPRLLSVYDTVFRCHKAAGHGVVDVHQALAQSCNVFFYKVGVPPGDRASRRLGEEAGPGRAHGDRPAPRGLGPHPEPGVEAARLEGAVVRRARRSRWPSARARSRSPRCRWRASRRSWPTAAAWSGRTS